MEEDIVIKELDQVVVRFSGDSGDGMQLAGNIFSTISATVGNDISTFPDYPADIRAPQGSLTGVSRLPSSSTPTASVPTTCARPIFSPTTIWANWA